MKHVIFTEVLGTICNLEELNDVFSINVQITKNIKESDVELVICTQSNEFEKLKRLSNHLGIRYLIYNNGKNIFDIKNNKEILENKINSLKDINKAKALLLFCEEHNINLANTMGIGSNKDDIEMIQTTAFSYAMANSSEDLKKVSKYHTSAIEQNGFDEAIMDYFYRNKISF